MSKKKKIIIASVGAAVLVALIITAITLSLVFMSKGPFSGTVTIEGSNEPVANVMVTDGRNVVKTDENGSFYLEGYYKSRFVTLTVPSGYNAQEFYIPVNKEIESYDFKLTKTDKSYENGHSFLQVSDTEINSPAGDWLDHVKGLVNELEPAFLIHTGDICDEKGLNQHIKDMNDQTMGVPVRYVIGNHDYVKWGGYGEALYESLYGPVWYSFDVGNVHYVVTPFQNGSDVASGYGADERWIWLENDLKNVDPNMKLVMFNHTTPPSRDYVIKYGSKQIDLKKHNLIAWVFGHYHYNYIEENGGVLNISTGRPDTGGIDSSLSGTRQISVNAAGAIETKMHYYDYTAPLAVPENFIWQNKAQGNFLFCEPLVVDGLVLAATACDDYPRSEKCGVFAFDLNDGTLKWAAYTENSIKNNLAYLDSKVVAQDASGKVYAFDIRTGELVWEYQAGLGNALSTSSGIIAEDKFVYVGCAAEITKLSIYDGKPVWNFKRNAGESSPSRFVIAGDKLIVGSHWDGLLILDKNTKKQLHLLKDEDIRFRSSTPALIDNETILVADDDAIMTVDLISGKIKNKYVSPKIGDDPIYRFNSSAQPSIGNTAYIATSNKGVVAYRYDRNEIIWNFETEPSLIHSAPYQGKGSKCVESSIISIGNDLIFGANDGYVYRISYDGSLIKKVFVGAPILGKCAVTKTKSENFVDYYDIVVCDFEGRIFKLTI